MQIIISCNCHIILNGVHFINIVRNSTLKGLRLRCIFWWRNFFLHLVFHLCKFMYFDHRNVNTPWSCLLTRVFLVQVSIWISHCSPHCSFHFSLPFHRSCLSALQNLSRKQYHFNWWSSNGNVARWLWNTATLTNKLSSQLRTLFDPYY